MTEERYKRIKDSIELQSLVKKQMRVEDELLQEEIELLKAYEKLQKENKQLKDQLLATKTNEETFRLEMEDITKILGLDENTLFDDVKVCVKSLKDNWNKLKSWVDYMRVNTLQQNNYGRILDKIQELEGSEN